MSDLEIVRRIRGNVHGTVDVTALENLVIDHPYVQRLRRIRQLAFLSLVFPGASHSRFEHSLGVMQLAGITWTKIRANQQRLAHSCSRYRDFAATEKQGVSSAVGGSGRTANKTAGTMVHGLLGPTFSIMDEIFAEPYTLQALRLAGLLHDIGHPPFSHSGERFLPSWKQVLHTSRGQVPAYLVEYLETSCVALAAEGKDPAHTSVRHEVYTLLLVDRLLTEVNKGIAATHRIAPRDVVSILSRHSAISPEPGSPLEKHGVYRLCHELISGEVDVDRMDYLLRDAHECGVVYGIFDATRIQDSLSLYYDTQDAGVHLAINFSGLAAFEDYLRARHSMYLQLYFHKTSVGAEAMMQHLARMLGGWTLPADLAAFAALDEYNIEAALKTAAAHLSPSELAHFQTLLSDLLRDRHLWKRVFEVASKHDAERQSGKATTLQAGKILAAMGVPYEQVSSASSLTTFRPRREHELSRNYLRLIKKDDYQFPRVYPIEDYTNLIANDTRVHISRIYVENKLTEDGRRLPDVIRQALTEKLRH